MSSSYPTLADLRKEFTPEKFKNEHLDKITNKLYLGDREGSLEFAFFDNEGITNVLSLIGDLSPEYEKDNKIIRKIINVDDSLTQNIIKYFKECIDFIEKSKKTYVHCMMGVSRSAAIIIAYLMWKTHSNYDDAYFFVKNKRRFIGPNDGFVLQLRKFDVLLENNNYDLDKIDFKNINYDCRLQGIL